MGVVDCSINDQAKKLFDQKIKGYFKAGSNDQEQILIAVADASIERVHSSDYPLKCNDLDCTLSKIMMAEVNAAPFLL